MQLPTMLAATTTDWPEAAVAIAGIALIASVSVVVVWQALATWRARIAVTREQAYRKLAEQTAQDVHEIKQRLAAMERAGEGVER